MKSNKAHLCNKKERMTWEIGGSRVCGAERCPKRLSYNLEKASDQKWCITVYEYKKNFKFKIWYVPIYIVRIFRNESAKGCERIATNCKYTAAQKTPR